MQMRIGERRTFPYRIKDLKNRPPALASLHIYRTIVVYFGSFHFMSRGSAAFNSEARKRTSGISDGMAQRAPEFVDPHVNCTFCKILRGDVEGRTPKLLYKDDEVAAFVDRDPSALRHLLVIPTAHINDISSLQPRGADRLLVQKMFELGQELLAKDAPVAPHRFGFHRPPFNSVSHLHLHCFALPFTSQFRAFKYLRMGSWSTFVEVQDVLAKL